MRFSIKAMLAVTALVAVSISGLLYANAVWAAAFFTGALALLLFGVVAIFLGKGASRAFWLGFTVFGAGYLGMSLMTQETTVRSRNAAWSDSKLVTTYLLLWSEPRLRRATPSLSQERALQRQQALALEEARIQLDFLRQLPRSQQVDRETRLEQARFTALQRALQQSGRTAATSIASERKHFLQVGLSIFTLLFALVGGWLGSWFYRRQAAEIGSTSG